MILELKVCYNFLLFIYILIIQTRLYIHKILFVIEPLLIDEDYYARVEDHSPRGSFPEVAFADSSCLLWG